ncbi:Hpa2p [Sugiyamaella lignohabitans]|uniref:Hpa2p n=1 Tax=Sugiyamaella lignohabitans TaxID=796027 RepID=A0A167CND9_9ASCO|nr:Hpa2p [Sugiyamaella lignohabitans]ANB11919.1 Hpa2p [Sugiyamaella lignohabitans]
MTVTIRPIEQSDKSQYSSLFAAYLVFYKAQLPEKILEKTWERFFDDKEPVYAAVAFDDESPEKLIGFVTYVFHRSTWQYNDVIYLHDLFVDPEVRSRGTGRKLIEYVYGEADKHEVAKVYWHTQIFNHRAQLLYTKVGVRDDFVSYQRPAKK